MNIQNMSTKVIIILLTVICLVSSQIISNERIDEIWSAEEEDVKVTTTNPEIDNIWCENDGCETTTTHSPQISDNTTNLTEECECVPYYLCDRSRIKKRKIKENYGEDKINIRYV